MSLFIYVLQISQCRLASSRDPSSFSVSPALLPPVVSSAESDSIERIGDWLQDVSTAKHMRRIANQAAAHFAHNKSKVGHTNYIIPKCK